MKVKKKDNDISLSMKEDKFAEIMRRALSVPPKPTNKTVKPSTIQKSLNSEKKR